jgi:hypothetical protein
MENSISKQKVNLVDNKENIQPRSISKQNINEYCQTPERRVKENDCRKEMPNNVSQQKRSSITNVSNNFIFDKLVFSLVLHFMCACMLLQEIAGIDRISNNLTKFNTQMNSATKPTSTTHSNTELNTVCPHGKGSAKSK